MSKEIIKKPNQITQATRDIRQARRDRIDREERLDRLDLAAHNLLKAGIKTIEIDANGELVSWQAFDDETEEGE